MKGVFHPLVILLIAINSYAQTPVAWYPFQGNANDSTGNGHNGTLMNNPVLTADENSNPNSAYHFNGSNQYISIPYDSAFNIPPNGQFTISLWLYADTTNSQARALFIKSPSNTAWDYGMYLFTNNRIMIGHNGVHTGWSRTQIIPKQWYCVTGTYNNGDYKIYINGVLDSAVINSGKYITQSTGGLAIAVKGQTLIDYFPGSLDNVAFYNVALSDSQIAALSCNDALLPPPPKSSFVSSDSAFCEGNCISFSDLSAGNPTSWQWYFPGAEPSSSIVQNPQNICYPVSGYYDVKLITGNSGGNDSLTFSNYINVFPLPPVPVITQSYDTLFCRADTNYISYQWYNDSTLVSGDTSSFLVITGDGNYNISVRNVYGCDVATGINIILGSPSFIRQSQVAIYPNPAFDKLQVRGYGMNEKSALLIYDVLGKAVLSHNLSFTQSQGETIDISALTKGIYIIEVTSANKSLRTKVVVE